MSRIRMGLPEICVALAIAAVLASPLAAQGKPKHYATTTDKAITITREVLVKQGYEVVKIEKDGERQVVWYRRGNQGRGKGKGKLEKMIITREKDRVIFVETPPAIMVDIDVRLRL
jgi:hypothetical protein